MSVRVAMMVLAGMLAAGAWAAPASSPALSQLDAKVQKGDRTALAQFWERARTQGTPLIEAHPADAQRALVTFVWRDDGRRDASDIGVVGVFNERPWQSHDRLQRLGTTDVLFRTYELDARARAPYAFSWPAGVVKGETPLWQETREGVRRDLFADPLNPKRIRDVFFTQGAEESWFEAPAAPPQPWLQRREGVKRGEVQMRQVRSDLLGNERDVAVYLPPGYRNSDAGYAFVMLFDGMSYLHSADVPTLLDNMIADRVLPPTIAIMVDYIDAEHRQRELSDHPLFHRFIAEELLPQLRGQFSLTRDPRQAAIGGASRGGLAAAYIAHQHPDQFGNVISQSGSFSWHPTRGEAGWLPALYAASERRELRFYLEAGSWENPALMLKYNDIFRDVLAERGYSVTYRQFVGGHTFLNWRASLPDALIELLGVRQRAQ